MRSFIPGHASPSGIAFILLKVINIEHSDQSYNGGLRVCRYRVSDQRFCTVLHFGSELPIWAASDFTRKILASPALHPRSQRPMAAEIRVIPGSLKCKKSDVCRL